jgi:hypothetical protein
MKKFITFAAAAVVAVGISISAATNAQAGIVEWDVDQTQSYGRITIPDFNYDTGVIGNVTIRPRNYNVNNNNAWNDAGGRLAPLDGTIKTNLVDGVSVQFLSGQSNLFAVETFNARPDAAQFNGTTFTGTAAAPAAYATNVRTSSFLASQAGLVAIRGVTIDLASGVVGLGGGTTIAGGSTDLGLLTASIGADFLGLIASAIDDQLLNVTSNDLFANSGAGTITNLGGLNRRLDLTVNLPLSFDIGGGVFLNGGVAGKIVAFGTAIPEPASASLAGLAMIGLCIGRRRTRRS